MWIKFLKLFVLFCCIGLSACGEQYPIFHDHLGNILHLSNLKNKWVIINYWAGWCPLCVKEIPELNRFYRTNKDITMYGVNFDQLQKENLQKAIQDAHIEFPVLIEDPAEALHLNPVNNLPTTFIIDPKGKVFRVILGATSTEALLEIIHSAKQ